MAHEAHHIFYTLCNHDGDSFILCTSLLVHAKLRPDMCSSNHLSNIPILRAS